MAIRWDRDAGRIRTVWSTQPDPDFIPMRDAGFTGWRAVHHIWKAWPPDTIETEGYSLGCWRCLECGVEHRVRWNGY